MYTEKQSEKAGALWNKSFFLCFRLQFDEAKHIFSFSLEPPGRHTLSWFEENSTLLCSNQRLDIVIKIAAIKIKLGHSFCHMELMVLDLLIADSLLFLFSHWLY